MMVPKILITGSAGFIGYHLSKRLIELNSNIIGIDNLNSYYDIELKNARVKRLKSLASKNKKVFADFIKVDLIDKSSIKDIFNKYKPHTVIHLAAQAGVRYSLTNPEEYIKSNLLGFSNILENLRDNNIKNFIYASSSSVYGGNKKVPFSERDSVNHPVSLYAATKKSNELMAHSYSHLYGIPSTALRFFTVYGPWGRPDMAPMIFTKAILSGKPIDIFNFGNMKRDFTYIDDVIDGVIKILKTKIKENSIILNIGKGKPDNLMDLINLIQKNFKKKFKIKFTNNIPNGDIKKTFSNTNRAAKIIKWKPKISLQQGVKKFVDWYKISNDYK